MSQVVYAPAPQMAPSHGLSMPAKLGIAAAVIVVLYILFKDKVDAYLASTSQPAGPSPSGPSPSGPSPSGPSVGPTPSPSPAPAPRPARPSAMVDCGYGDRPRGWYDVKNRGYRNDFCRHVGDYPGWWTCAVQGDTNADGTVKVYSDRGVYQYDPNAPFDPYTGDLTGWHCP